MNILVLGGTRFFGIHMVNALLGEGRSNIKSSGSNCELKIIYIRVKEFWSMYIRIKRAELSDVNALYNLNKAFNGDCTTEELIKDSLLNNKQEIVLIAYADDNPAGFLCGQICHSMCYKTLHGEVGELYVHEECCRQGIGKKLIEQIEVEFKKLNIFIVDITTSVENHTAQAFYSNCGYIGKTKLIFRKRI